MCLTRSRRNRRVKTKCQAVARILLCVFVLAFFGLTTTPALAVEGGLARPISEMQIAPFAGVIPPEPGFAVATSEIYYSGSIGGAANVEIGGLLVANVDVKASFTPITLLYIWPTPTKEWNFASAVEFPLAWVECEASVSAHSRSGEKTASSDCTIWFLLRL
jgi:hypothetical protein